MLNTVRKMCFFKESKSKVYNRTNFFFPFTVGVGELEDILGLVGDLFFICSQQSS
jgi:hypothetical protein